MKKYKTIYDLASDTKAKISELSNVIDVLLEEFQEASTLIEGDLLRKKILSQLAHINKTIILYVKDCISDKTIEKASQKLVKNNIIRFESYER